MALQHLVKLPNHFSLASRSGMFPADSESSDAHLILQLPPDIAGFLVPQDQKKAGKWSVCALCDEQLTHTLKQDMSSPHGHEACLSLRMDYCPTLFCHIFLVSSMLDSTSTAGDIQGAKPSCAHAREFPIITAHPLDNLIPFSRACKDRSFSFGALVLGSFLLVKDGSHQSKLCPISPRV